MHRIDFEHFISQDWIVISALDPTYPKYENTQTEIRILIQNKKNTVKNRVETNGGFKHI